jgi:hypothetical protein
MQIFGSLAIFLHKLVSKSLQLLTGIGEIHFLVVASMQIPSITLLNVFVPSFLMHNVKSEEILRHNLSKGLIQYPFGKI